MKIVILDGYTENPGDLSWGGFQALGETVIYDRTSYSAQEGANLIISRAKGADAVIVNKTPLTREILLALAPELKYIGVLATGYNVVDTAAAKEIGVPVCNIPTYGTTAVAQFVFALLLEMCHHVDAHSEAVYQGAWQKQPDFCFWNYPLIELAGKTMGIIGFGRIGQTTAKIANAFGMKVLAYDEHVCPELENDGISYVSLDELFHMSDVISLHCPLFPSTKGIINQENIAKMKDGAFLINTSRGPLIDEQALANALNEGKLAGAAVDVVSTEPIQEDNPLLKAKNCLITPHIAWAPKESRQRLMDIAVDNLRAFIAGQPKNVVNEM